MTAEDSPGAILEIDTCVNGYNGGRTFFLRTGTMEARAEFEVKLARLVLEVSMTQE